MSRQTNLGILEHFGAVDDPLIKRSKEHRSIDIVTI